MNYDRKHILENFFSAIFALGLGSLGYLTGSHMGICYRGDAINGKIPGAIIGGLGGGLAGNVVGNKIEEQIEKDEEYEKQVLCSFDGKDYIREIRIH